MDAAAVLVGVGYKGFNEDRLANLEVVRAILKHFNSHWEVPYRYSSKNWTTTSIGMLSTNGLIIVCGNKGLDVCRE